MKTSELFVKLMRYCAYRERCTQEVEEKLLELGADEDQVEEVLFQLKEDRFVNNRRFAEEYVNSKFVLKKWGRYKIRNGLRKKGILQKLIDAAIKKMIIDEVYLETMQTLALKKATALAGYEEQKDLKNCKFLEKRKIRSYLIQKGYEGALIEQLFR